MDRERLTELLQDPSQVAKQDLADLRSMTERFPWFSGAHLLLAVGEHETGDVLANDRRSQPAAYLPSRSVLFDLVRKEEPAEPSSLRVVKNVEPVGESNPVEIQPNPQAPVSTGTVHRLPKLDKAKDITPEGTHVALEEASAPLTEEAVEVEAPLGHKPDPERDVLDRQIVEAVQASGYELIKLANSFQPQAKPLPKEEVVLTAAEHIGSIPLPPVAEPPPAPVATPQAQRPMPGPHTRLRFTDWLDQDELPGPEEVVSSNPPKSEVLPSSSTAPLSPAPDVLSQQDIMEHFIQHTTPAPATEKAVFFNPQQAAKRSLLDDGLVSETLARIHEKQGNFSKAREVYDRLAVKHPEKSVYFAALSKALEARSNK